MKSTTFSEPVKRFFSPLSERKHACVTIGIASLITASLYIFVAGLIAENCISGILAAEMARETGPEFLTARDLHAQMLRKYTGCMNERRLSFLLDLLYPEYSPKRQFGPVFSMLEQPLDNDDQAREVLHKAARQVKELYDQAGQFSQVGFIWPNYRKLPSWLSKDLNNELAKSSELIVELANRLTLNNAKASCMAHREAIVDFGIARLIYNYSNKEKINQLLKNVQLAGDCMANLGDKRKKENNQYEYDLLKKWEGSEQRRVIILKAMLNDDVDMVCPLLREAIEKGFEEDSEKVISK